MRPPHFQHKCRIHCTHGIIQNLYVTSIDIPKKIKYPKWDFSLFFSVPTEEIWDSISKHSLLYT